MSIPTKAYLGATEIVKRYLGGTVIFDNTAPTPATFTDNFNRANQNLEASADWTRVLGSPGGATISGNEVFFNDGSSTGSTYLCPDLGSADHYTQVVRPTSGVGNYYECCVRITDGNNFIGLRRNSGGKWELSVRDGGSFNHLGNVSAPAPQAGDIIRVEAQGNQITAFVNGVPIIGPATSTAHMSVTSQGFVARNSVTGVAAIDNFEAGTL